MFSRLTNIIRKPVRIYFEGELIEALEGDTIASALLAAGVTDFRHSVVSESERGPYCLMGACFECLMEIDGIGHQQACLIPVRDEMRICRENAKRSIVDDL
ncbi:MAG: sarcosine oxidase [Rhodospirillaceae bacterium]|nr:sarcosine oxidase [Rhodospirillaceae bacterium]